MVDSTLQLPQEGTGPKTPAIQTIVGANTIKIPISLIAGFKTYVARVMASAAAANKNHLVLFNGTGSGKIIRVWDIKVNPNITGTTAANTLVLNTARCSNSGTGGTSQSIIKTDTTDSNEPAEITAVAGPASVTYNSNELASCSVVLEESGGTEGRNTLYKADSVLSALVLNEGQGLGIQQGTNARVSAINIFMYFTID